MSQMICHLSIVILDESFEFPSPNDTDEIGIVAFGGDFIPTGYIKLTK